MNPSRVRREIARVADRYRTLWRRRALACTWAAAALMGVALLTCFELGGWSWPWAVPALLVLVALVALVCMGISKRIAADLSSVARRIEASHPELDSRLLAALEQRPDPGQGRLGFLQESVIREVLAHSRRTHWGEAVPERSLRQALGSNLAALTLFAMTITVLVAVRERTEGEPAVTTSGSVQEVPSLPYEVTVDPGTIDIERGSSLIILARFAEAVPPGVVLVVRGEEAGERRLAMKKSLDDPLFGARLPSVVEDITYHVEFADERSSSYRVSVFDYPALVRADAELEFPAYTGLEPRTVVDTRTVTAVEGTRLRWVLHLNKPVVRAWLVREDSVETGLGEGEGENVRSGEWTLERSHRYEVRLIDAGDRENRDPPELTVSVIPNRPPELQLTAPSRDVRVSPIEELFVEASVKDDFGVGRLVLSYTLAGQPPREEVLLEDAPGKESLEASHILDFEALGAEPDQLLSYYFRATDAGPDGSPRQVYSDMYFAEVRPFEEIFRQGEQPPGGAEEQQQREREQQEQEGQQGQGSGVRQAEELAELEKQIVTGTWNLIRRESGDLSAARGSDGDLAADAATLRDAQQSALEQTQGLEESLGDPQSRGHLDSARTQMSEALQRLSEAAENPSGEPLRDALAAEQLAYQSLLRLRAREHEVIRAQREQQPSSSRSRSNSRSQQQLQQLQLSNSRSRYEMQRQSSPRQEESPAQREDRQALNRLRELSRRQADLNERLKELQSALAEAQDEESREEIRRQLQRLRDEEQRILRDTDELTDRMEQPTNQERMAEAREQLRDTRDNVRRASEALEEGQVSRALADGTRAEREFQELRDEFQQRTAQRFEEEMRQMRNDAESLERNQEELADRLAGLEDRRGGSLRGASEREQVEEGLAEQEQELEGLLERMQETVEQAEEPEPLLAEKLYDTIREARHNRTEEALDVTRQLLESGFIDESEVTEREVREGLRELREGVEEAAESVLGDGTDALRRAAEELDRLSEDVEREIARAEPREDSSTRRTRDGRGEESGEPQEDRRQPGERQPGERQPGGQQDGERQQGERQPGAQQGGERQPGERQPGERQPGGQQPGERQPGEQQPGERQPGGQQDGERQQGERQPGAQQGGERQPGERQPGGQQPEGGGTRGTDERPQVARGASDDRPEESLRGRRTAGGPRDAQNPREARDGRGGLERLLGGPEEVARELSPLAGEDFRDWSDRLRDAEEMIDDPELRAEAARIRERARGIRQEVRRHSKEPEWDLVRMTIVEPLDELRQQVIEEVERRSSTDSLVPIDRDPVPPEYSETVRRYYERLGSGR